MKPSIEQQPGSVALDHAAVQALLPEYVALAAEGAAPEQQFPAAAAHLVTCDECRSALSALLDLTALVGSATLDRPSQTPDLSFLKAAPAPATAPPLLRSSRGQLLVTLSQPILSAWQQPQLAGAFRGRLLYRATYTTTVHPPAEVQLEIRAEGENLCIVSVTVQEAERDPFDQQGTLARLTVGRLVLEATSDESGTISFSGIPRADLPGLRLSLSPAQAGEATPD